MNEKQRVLLSRYSVAMNRIASLQDDGYIVVVDHQTATSIFTKLRHRTNGNIVKVSCDLEHDTMTQVSNGDVVYCGNIQG